MINKIMKITNKIRAISIDISSTPVNPSSPATIARIKKVITASNIGSPFDRIIYSEKE